MQKVTFNNKTSPFFDSLKSKVETYFENNKVESTGNEKLYVKSIVLLTLAAFLYVLLVFFTPPMWLSILLCIVMGFTVAGIGFNVMHDAAHGSYSENKKLNNVMAWSLNLMGASSFMWKIKHNIIHHSYTNIEGMDDDINIQPFFRVNDQQKRYWFHRFQHYYCFLFYGVTYFIWVFYLDFNKYFSGSIGPIKIRKMEWHEHVGFWFTKVLYVFTAIVIPVSIVGWGPALLGFGIIQFVCGVIISTIFQLAHVVEHAEFPEPNPATQKIEEEWAAHQVMTTVNFSPRSYLIRWFSGGLNYQIEHHLFPRISHIHYPAISPLVKETCKEYGIPYNQYPTFFKAVQSHVLHLKMMASARVATC